MSDAVETVTLCHRGQSVLLRSLGRRHFLIKGQNIRLGTQGRDRMRVDLHMALRVVVLDMGELGRAFESVVIPVAVSHPSFHTSAEPLEDTLSGHDEGLLMERGIPAANIADVAFEMLDVDGIKADDGLRSQYSASNGICLRVTYGIESNVCFSHAISMIIWSWRLGKLFLGSIKRFEELIHVLLVCFLRSK